MRTAGVEGGWIHPVETQKKEGEREKRECKEREISLASTLMDIEAIGRSFTRSE